MRELIPVSAEVLVWARRSALASESEVAKGIGRPVETVLAWESGRAQPSYSQLEKLADEYGVSVNALLLPRPPKGQEPPPDYRSASGRGHEPIGRRTRRELRRARYLQEIVANAKILPPTALPRVRPDQDAADAARTALGVSIERQLAWRSEQEAFREWRAALTRLGVLVFQFPLNVEELRGLSLPAPAGRPPVILVNQSDWPNSRVFTLLHELGHLVLAHQGGICDPWRHGPRASSSSLETRCNRFAGGVLVPGAHLERQDEVQLARTERDSAGRIRLLKALGHRYRVSPQVVWYRMHEKKLVSDAAFRALWPELRPPPRPRRRADEERDMGIPRWRRAQTGYGSELVSGLLGAADRGALSHVQVIRALNVGVSDLTRLQGDLSGD